MKSKTRYFVLFFVICFTLSCSKDLTNQIESDFSGESRPAGPLRVSNSKVKSETYYPLDSNNILERTNYEYYGNGLLKTKTKASSDLEIYSTTHYYYDSLSNLIKEVVFDGNTFTDTIEYRYDSLNRLVQKETLHSTPNFTLRDTVFYKYDIEGNLVESIRRDPHKEYAKSYRDKFEYLNGLLMKAEYYYGGDLINSIVYKYFNEIMTEKFVYTAAGLLEHRYVYYYNDGLLVNVKGYGANFSDVSDQIFYKYNKRYELVIEKVYVPRYSSHIDHEIHYKYY